MRAAAARAWVAGLVPLSLLFALSYGLRYGVHNQHTYLLRGARQADPALFARDWLVAQATDYHPAFSALVGWMMATGRAGWTIALANVLVLMAAALVFHGLARAVSGSRAPAVFLLLTGYAVFAAQHEVIGSVAVSALFTNYLVPANLGSLGLLAAVLFHLQGRFVLSGLAAALGGVFHANFLVLAPPMFLLAHVVVRPPAWRRTWLTQIAPCVLVLLVRLPELLALGRDSHAAEGRLIFMSIRSPHHYLPLTFLRDFAFFYGWQLVGLIGCWRLSERTEPLDRLRGLLVSVFALVTAATLLTTVVFVPAVAQLYVFRLAPFGVLLAQLAFCARALTIGRRLRAERWWPAAAAAAGAVLFALGAALGLPGIRSEATALGSPLAAEEKLYGWAQTRSPDALFAVPPDLHGFRLGASRAIVVDWKSTPIRGSEVREWYRRLLLVSGRPRVANLDDAVRGYQTMGPHRIERLRAQLGVDFIVLRQPFPRTRLPEHRVAFADRKFIVFEARTTSLP